MIGPVTETLYGHTFDVQTEDKPINVAYSSVGLGFHVDLAYYESPPGLQLLHCLQFDDMVLGGESIFLDGFCIAEEFREKFPHHFETLTRVPATFQKFHFERANPAAYIYQRPHINVNRTGQVCKYPSLNRIPSCPRNQAKPGKRFPIFPHKGNMQGI
eukprot:XP_011672801.1 PREDICTED: gamma-butyrobetaine dioxygenase [Strongylocentrotus purpuratus]